MGSQAGTTRMSRQPRWDGVFEPATAAIGADGRAGCAVGGEPRRLGLDMLLTKRLCGRDKRRAGVARRQVLAPDAPASAVAARSRHAQKTRIMAISRVFPRAC